MSKQHGNFNKQATPKQRLAQQRNGQVWRLKGLRGNLHNILADGLGHEPLDFDKTPATYKEREDLRQLIRIINTILYNTSTVNKELGLKK